MSGMGVHDYSEDRGEDSHYNGVPSQYGKRVEAQEKAKERKYCWPGDADGHHMREMRNEQKGP
jgi:hypothetical protein